MFFFSSRRRHTRFDCDWSSDVCSSDLQPSTRLFACHHEDVQPDFLCLAKGLTGGYLPKIGKAAGRERGEISGGAGSLKKKKNRAGNDRQHGNRMNEAHSVESRVHALLI